MRCVDRSGFSLARLKGLKQLDRISRRVLDENLHAAVAGDDFVPEMSARIFQLLHRGLDIFDLDLDTVPAARRRKLSSDGSSSAAGPRPIEQQL